jgi:hypothetical protein
MVCVAVGQTHLLSYVVWLNFDRASKRGGSRGGRAQNVEMASQIGKLGAAMEERELAALASVKNPYRIKQQSLVVNNGKSVQQLAWKNAGAVADPNVFNHPVHAYTFQHARGHSQVMCLCLCGRGACGAWGVCLLACTALSRSISLIQQ